jgi:ferric-dicitrate binding protein FerR (iron transport regulator)
VSITGEAYFEVAHNALMPFDVKVGNIKVKVLGTHFNVNAYDDEDAIKTTLLQGSVKVSKGNEDILIVPGEQVRVNKASAKITVKKNIDLEEVVAWKNGLFQFDQAGIKTIMRQIARWYDIDVEFEDGLPDKKYDGKIYRNVNASQVLKILEEGGIHFKIENKKVIVSPR